MNQEEFEKVVEETIEEIKYTLIVKGKEYTEGDDRLSNLKDTAVLECTIPEWALFTKTSKHIIAERDFILRLINGEPTSRLQWLEKSGDMITYQILLRALLKERGSI